MLMLSLVLVLVLVLVLSLSLSLSLLLMLMLLLLLRLLLLLLLRLLLLLLLLPFFPLVSWAQLTSRHAWQTARRVTTCTIARLNFGSACGAASRPQWLAPVSFSVHLMVRHRYASNPATRGCRRTSWCLAATAWWSDFALRIWW